MCLFLSLGVVSLCFSCFRALEHRYPGGSSRLLGQTGALINVQCRGEDLTHLLSRDLVLTVNSSNELDSCSIPISSFYTERKS